MGRPCTDCKAASEAAAAEGIFARLRGTPPSDPVAPVCSVGKAGIHQQLGVCSAQNECGLCESFGSEQECVAHDGGIAHNKRDGSGGCRWQAELGKCTFFNLDYGVSTCPMRDSSAFTLCSSLKISLQADYYPEDCNFASRCDDTSKGGFMTSSATRATCENYACKWSVETSTCSGCDCECNGCFFGPPPGTPDWPTCWPSYAVDKETCESHGGSFCSCAAKAAEPTQNPQGNLGCTSIFSAKDTRRPGTISQAEATAAAKTLCESTLVTNAFTHTVSKKCKWSADMFSAERDSTAGNQLLMGRCGECFADTDCDSGSCNLPVTSGTWDDPEVNDWSNPANRYHECNEKCDGEHHCQGRGEAKFDPISKTCTCTSCEAGWKGDRCDVIDCTHAPSGEDCGRCNGFRDSAPNKCQASDGEVYLCQYDEKKSTCGRKKQKDCSATVQCGNHGKALGDATQICYCDCEDGWFGPRCNSPSPPQVVATKTGHAEQDMHVIKIVSNENNRYLRIQTCEDPSFSCTGNPDAPNAYIHSSDWLPPRLQGASLYIRKETTYIVFVDLFCPMTDFEIWRPKGGWQDLSSITVPFVCGKNLDLGEGSMATLGGYDPGQLECIFQSDCQYFEDWGTTTRHDSCKRFNPRWCKSGKVRQLTPCVGAKKDPSVPAQPATCSLEQCCAPEEEQQDAMIGSISVDDILAAIM